MRRLTAAKTKTDKLAEEIASVIKRMRKKNETLTRIADELTREGKLTPRGRSWAATAVKCVIDRTPPR